MQVRFRVTGKDYTMAYQIKPLNTETSRLLGNDVLVATKVVRVYCAYQKRNEWTSWHGDTDVVNRPTGDISLSLDVATAGVERNRTPGTTFSIEDGAALAFIGKKAAVLIVDFHTMNPFRGVKTVNPPLEDIWQLNKLAGVIPSEKFRKVYVFVGTADEFKEYQNTDNLFHRNSTAGGKRNGLAWTLKPVILDVSALRSIASQLEPPLPKAIETASQPIEKGSSESFVPYVSAKVGEFISNIEPILSEDAELVETSISNKPNGVRVPRTIVSEVAQYQRDPAIKEWVLQQARGKCECCDRSAPFVGVGGMPFLEVHHVLQMANGGSDTLSNTVALCPNCHREFHHGANATELVERLYNSVSRLVREQRI